MFIAAACMRTPLDCSWGCQVFSLWGTLLELAVCRLLHCSRAAGSVRAGRHSTLSPGAQVQSLTHVEMSCDRCLLCAPVFAAWGQMSFFAEDCKSNRVCSAVLAEQPNRVQSFGLGENCPSCSMGWVKRFPVPQLHPVPLPAEVWEMLWLRSIYSRPAAVGWKFFGSLCMHGGKQGAEQSAAHPPEQCMRLGTAWWSDCKRLGAAGWGLQGSVQSVEWTCG